MTNRYRALHPSVVAIHGDDVFDADYTAVDEADLVDRHLVELVPRPYRVLSENYTIDGQPVANGTVVEATFPVEIEAALIGGGHLERADPKPAAKRRAPASKEK